MSNLETKNCERTQQLVECAERAKKFFDEVMPQIGKLCIQDYQNLNELGMILNQIDAQPKIEPVFSGDFGIYTHNYGIDANYSLWQKARVRIIEKINIANNGDNGFKADGDNYPIAISPKSGELATPSPSLQHAEPMLYLRTLENARKLLRDHQFCEDMRTYFKGWL